MKAITQQIDQTGRVVSAASVLPSGSAGTQRTLVLMRESVLAALLKESVLNAAFVAAGLAGQAGTARAEVERVQTWVQKNIRYVLDPVQIELLQAPEVTLMRRQGDCDDQSALTCALLTALGYECRLVAVGFAPGAFAHVYTEVRVGNEWLACETIKPWPLGKSPDGVKAKMRMVIAAPEALRGQVGGLFSSIKKAVTNVVRHPIDLIKNPLKTIKEDLKLLPTAAAGFVTGGGPWGAVAAVAVAKVGQASQQLAAKKMDAQAKAEFEKIATETGQQLAEAASQPQRAAEYADRIRKAADPQKEVERIIGEFQAAALEPKASPVAAATVAAVVPSPATATGSGNTISDFISANKLAVGIGGGVLLALLLVAATSGGHR